MKDLKYIAALKDTQYSFNDIEIDGEGDIVTLENEALLKQEIVKILLTESGLMPYPNYGTALAYLTNQQPYSPKILDTVSDEVVSAVHYLIFISESENDRDIIAEISELDVSYADSVLNINLRILTAARAIINIGLSV